MAVAIPKYYLVFSGGKTLSRDGALVEDPRRFKRFYTFEDAQQEANRLNDERVDMFKYFRVTETSGGGLYAA